MVETLKPDHNPLIDECTFTAVGKAALIAADEKGALSDSAALRQEFLIQLIEMADAYDSMDHRIGPAGGSELQNDCQTLREFVRSLPK